MIVQEQGHGAGGVVFLLPHPDDEMGAYPWLQRAARRGPVRCIYLTDGGFGGQDVARREAESRSVLAGLGVHDLRFLGREAGIGDGSLHAGLPHLRSALPAAFDGLPTPLEIYAPAWEGGHQDHDAAHLVGVWIAQRLGAGLYQFPLYTGDGLPGPLFRMLAALPGNGPAEHVRVPIAERLACLRRMLGYRSQWKTLVGLLPMYTLALMAPRAFPRQRVATAAYVPPQHAATPLYERRGFLTRAAFDAATADLRRDIAAA